MGAKRRGKVKRSEKIINLVEEHMGPFTAAFNLMELAEEVIRKAIEAEPDEAKKGLIKNIFKYLAPHQIMLDKPRLFEAHCQELINRLLTNIDLLPATDAEILAAIVEGSFKAPLSRDGAAAYARLFVKLFPEQAAMAELLSSETYPGAVDEIIYTTWRRIGKRKVNG